MSAVSQLVRRGKRGVTENQLRALLKEAFEEGFRAARQGTWADAWEASIIRKEIDLHGLHTRLVTVDQEKSSHD